MANAENHALELAVEITKSALQNAVDVKLNEFSGVDVANFLKVVYKSIIDIDKG